MLAEIRKVFHMFNENRQLGDCHASNMGSAGGTIKLMNNMYR